MLSKAAISALARARETRYSGSPNSVSVVDGNMKLLHSAYTGAKIWNWGENWG